MWIANWISLKMQGMTPRRVVPSERRTIDWDTFDAILIGGGDDIDVQLYDGIPTPNVRIDPARDHLELDAIEKFLKNGRPILGVCRGSQMLNVALGGSLHEDMYEAHQDAPRIRTVLARKSVHLTEGSFLRAVFGRAMINANSLHSQSVDCLGTGLMVAARDSHNIIQAVERDHLNVQFLVGVQWHPEFLFYRASHRRLFRAFACAARGEDIQTCTSLADQVGGTGREPHAELCKQHIKSDDAT